MSTELMQTSGSIEPEVVCPSCGTPYQCIDKAHSKYFVCGNCKTYYKYNEEYNNYEAITIIGENSEYAAALTFKIGDKAVFSEVEYVVVGIIYKQSVVGKDEWIEYLLHSSSIENYLTVSEWNGHYTLVWPTSLEVFRLFRNENRDRYLKSDGGKVYNDLNKYTFISPGLWGEFDWDVQNDDRRIIVEEYLNYKDLIIRERNKRSRTAQGFAGLAVTRKEIIKAFGITKADLPPKKSTYIPDVGRRLALAEKRAVVALVFLATMFVIFLLSMSGNNETVVQSFTTSADTTHSIDARHFSTKSFEISAAGIVETKIYSTIENSWISVVTDLVNESTGEVIEGEKDFEYYSGVEGGESWSEGSPGGSFKFSRVKRGKYHLEIVVQQESGKPQQTVLVDVIQGTSSGSNLIWMMLLVAALPTMQWIYLHDKYKKLMFGYSD